MSHSSPSWKISGKSPHKLSVAGEAINVAPAQCVASHINISVRADADSFQGFRATNSTNSFESVHEGARVIIEQPNCWVRGQHQQISARGRNARKQKRDAASN